MVNNTYPLHPRQSDRETFAQRKVIKEFRKSALGLKGCKHQFLKTSLSLRGNKGPVVSREEGWKILRPGSVPRTEQIVELCQKIFNEKLNNGSCVASEENYLNDVLDKHDIVKYPELFHFVTQNYFLSMVSQYLNDFPMFQGLRMFWTPKNDNINGSQQYHLDPVDNNMLKFFLLIEDVDEENGPFTMLPQKMTNLVVEKSGYQSGRLSDDDVYAHVSEEDSVKFMGTKGTIGVCNTGSCLHFGGRSRGKDRLLLMFSFTSMTPYIVREHANVVAAKGIPMDYLRKSLFNPYQ